MIDLSATSGLPLSLDDSRPDLPVTLGGLRPGALHVRSLAELRPSLADQGAVGPDPAYYMYRGVATLSATNAAGTRAYNWRYDITLFPPGRYGEEYLRTVGHYHPPERRSGIAYPEVYEVLAGEALFILQRVDDHRGGPSQVTVFDVMVLRAEAGEKAMMLPSYGHWTVNATDAPLVVSNWICGDFASHYESAVEARGPCCYAVVGEDGPCLKSNPHYANRPERVAHARPVDAPKLGLIAGRPIFHALQAEPDVWRYLCAPDQSSADPASAIRVTKTELLPA